MPTVLTAQEANNLAQANSSIGIILQEIEMNAKQGLLHYRIHQDRFPVGARLRLEELGYHVDDTNHYPIIAISW